MTEAVRAAAKEAPLEDLMVAMDVVDTVRHRELVVDRELDAAGRRRRLLERLREIYRAQGIDVTDAALEAGVDALEQERFAYAPTRGGPALSLARLYVRRDRWLKPVAGVLGLGLLIWIVWFFTVSLPEARARAELPRQLDATHARIGAIAASPQAGERAEALRRQASRAIAEDRYDNAEAFLGEMQALLGELETGYEIRIVSRPNALSGVWRVPELNPDARNYYLIVEAVTSGGSVVPVRVRNEEDGRTREVSAWGLRVSEETFEAVAADKKDDGIIQDNVVGEKRIGRIEPEYRVPTSGAAITEW